MAVIVYYFLRKGKKSRFDPDEYLQSFMYDVLDVSKDDLRIPSKSVLDQKELAFVITGALLQSHSKFQLLSDQMKKARRRNLKRMESPSSSSWRFMTW